MAKKNWGFDTKNIDTSVRPQDDFYYYAVGNWLKTHSIPENESRWGPFTILHQKTSRQLRKLLTDIGKKKRVASGSPEQMIRDLYVAATDMHRRAKLGTTPIEAEQKKIRAISNRDELKRRIGELHLSGTGGLWGLGIDQDMKKTDRYIFYMSQGGLGMPDRDYYLMDAPEQKRVRSAYVKHIAALLRLAYIPAGEIDAWVSTVMRIETELAKTSMRKEELRDPHKVYHKYSFAELKKLAPTIDWKQYFTKMGAVPRELIVTQPAFMRRVAALIEKLPLRDWQIYLEWHLINDSSGSLSPAFEKQSFAFYGTCLAGTEKMKPRWRIALGTVNACVGEQLGKLYVAKHFGPEAKRHVNEIVDNLFAVYERRIKVLDWMGPATKKQALRKLRSMQRKLGYPDKWKSYRGLVIRPDDHYGNLTRSHTYEWKREVKKLGGPIDRTEWFMYPQTVNAYYATLLNEIVFPAGILQHPFFELSADDAVNYGAMGMIIGHELTHGFDDEGSQFDAKGNLRKWWTPADRKRFEKKANIVKRQYDRFVVEGLHVNGKLTLGENIADLGGLTIAYEAYQKQLEKTGRKDINGFTPEQRFFLGYAQSEHELRRPESTKLAILTDPHSPSECRVNGPLSNMPEFYEAFGVSKGDKLYRAPKDRAQIW